MKDIPEIIKEVYNHLGTGYRENIYERAICYELLTNNIRYECQLSMDVKYKDEVIGELICDIALPDRKEIIELKAIYSVKSTAILQLFTYINACNYFSGYVVNYTKDTKNSIQIIHVYRFFGYFKVCEYNHKNDLLKKTFYDFKGNFVEEEKVMNIVRHIQKLSKRRVWIDIDNDGYWSTFYFIDGLFYRHYEVGVRGWSIEEFEETYTADKYKVEEL